MEPFIVDAASLVPGGIARDGSDVTVKVQAAVDAARVEGLPIGFRAGEYGVRAPIVYENQGLVGAGRTLTTFKQLNGDDSGAWNRKGVFTDATYLNGQTGKAAEIDGFNIQLTGKYGSGVTGVSAMNRYSNLFIRGGTGLDEGNSHGLYLAPGALTATAVAIVGDHLRLGTNNTRLKLVVGNAQLTDHQWDHIVCLVGGKAPNDLDFGGAGGMTARHLKHNGGARKSAIIVRGILETTISDLHVDGWGMDGSGAAVEVLAERGSGGISIFGGTVQFRAHGPNVRAIDINPAITSPVSIVGVNSVQSLPGDGAPRYPSHAQVAGNVWR